MKPFSSSKSHLWPILSTIPLFVGAAWLVGCGGGTSGGGGSTETPTAAPGANRTFYSAFNSVLVGNNNLVNVARGFVTLRPNANIPVEVGIELTDKAVTDLPKPQNFNSPVIYGINLPAESVYTPFSFIAISYWSAHKPRGTGDIAHFHPLLGMDPPQQPTAECGSVPIPANCGDEATDVTNAGEIPQDYISAEKVPAAGDDAIAPGIGLAYEDVKLPQPQLVPGWNSIGQNYFFYKGHMNGIGLSATNDYLLKQEKGTAPVIPAAVYVMKQPKLYPKAGYYPTRQVVRYDAKRKVHVISVTDFIAVSGDQVAPAPTPSVPTTTTAKSTRAVICVPSNRPLPRTSAIIWGPDGAPTKR